MPRVATPGHNQGGIIEVLGLSLSHIHTVEGCGLLLIEAVLPSDPQYSLLQDIASPKFSTPSPVRTVIVADFDNDQELEVFFNNIAYRSSAANRLFRYQIQAMGAGFQGSEKLCQGEDGP